MNKTLVVFLLLLTLSCAYRGVSGTLFLPAEGCYEQLRQCDEKNKTIIRTYSADWGRVQVALTPLAKMFGSDRPETELGCLHTLGIQDAQTATVIAVEGGEVLSGPEVVLKSTLRVGDSWAAFGDRVRQDGCAVTRTVSALAGDEVTILVAVECSDGLSGRMELSREIWKRGLGLTRIEGRGGCVVSSRSASCPERWWEAFLQTNNKK